MKNLFLALSFTALFTSCFSQSNTLQVAFYNQENLFDTINDPNKNDEEFLPEGKYSWNSERYFTKLNNMAKVISSMNNNQGPDFLGMCELESEIALKDLLNTDALKSLGYNYAFAEGPDERGIDNTFIYKKDKVKYVSFKSHVINPEGLHGDRTRNILQVDAVLKNGSNITFFVNHFPSRREGQAESAFKREFVASVLRKICDSLQKSNPKQNIVIIGDFNDTPTDSSILYVLRAKAKVADMQKGDFFNTGAELASNGMGSYCYKKEWSLIDQVIVNNNLLNAKSDIKYKAGSFTIYKQEWMMESDPRFLGTPKRTFAGTKFLNGYSDHLPVYILVEVE